MERNLYRKQAITSAQDVDTKLMQSEWTEQYTKWNHCIKRKLYTGMLTLHLRPFYYGKT